MVTGAAALNYQRLFLFTTTEYKAQGCENLAFLSVITKEMVILLHYLLVTCKDKYDKEPKFWAVQGTLPPSELMMSVSLQPIDFAPVSKSLSTDT